MPEATNDPDIVISDRQTGDDPWIEYTRLSTGQVWRVRGACNQCGLCVIGVNDPNGRYVWDGPPGTPLASRDLWYGTRLDDPLTVGFGDDMREMASITPTATVSGCSLVFEER